MTVLRVTNLRPNGDEVRAVPELECGQRPEGQESTPTMVFGAEEREAIVMQSGLLSVLCRLLDPLSVATDWTALLLQAGSQSLQNCPTNRVDDIKFLESRS